MGESVICPQCGGHMVAQGAASAALVADTSSDSGVNNSAAEKHARDIRKKVDALGLIYKCGACGYAMRHKPAAALEAPATVA
jgi:predicted RNA-binding Zn-ribbon protein involved in translation (DUF1610 family)